jgi:HEAT repeat protein
MSVAVSKIVNLLAADRSREVRLAALTVLGELGLRESAVATAVLTCLDDDDAEVRLRAIRAAGQLRLEQALPRLADRLKHGGEEAEAAAEAAAQMGVKGIDSLRSWMGKIVPGVRRYIASALARAAIRQQRRRDLDILVDKDPHIVEAAVAAMAQMIPHMTAKEQRFLAAALLQMGGGKRTRLAPHAEAGVMRLAGLLNDERIAPLLWGRVLPPHPPEARAAALQALGQWIKSPNKEERERLFQCAADTNFQVAAPALMILDRLPLDDKLVPGFISLLHASDVAARRLALTKVGHRDEKEVVDALVESMRHPDATFRNEVMEKLGGTRRGRKALVKQLLQTESLDEAWSIARFLLPHARKNAEEWFDELFTAAISAIEAGDRRAEPLLFLLRETQPGALRDRLDQRAQTLVKKQDFEKALLVYRVLARDPAIGFPIRLGLAMVGLKLSQKQLEEHARAQDPCLHHFALLAADHAADVLRQLEKTAWIRADELYYLGFHFADATGTLKNFAADVLRLLIKKFPKDKAAASAKSKLKTIR